MGMPRSLARTSFCALLVDSFEKIPDGGHTG